MKAFFDNKIERGDLFFDNEKQLDDYFQSKFVDTI